ncbi:hypothetical protein [Micromonospora craniellae]|uniref:Uncharacterized protein n=1 Tax=Micromonospora craniellae TaxID=2294034 RepID=A0A372G6Q9_9ACTN|nr:hypothetical protein [Micromonospora craniellae]QOC90211.1 hypothetical protein ID554_18665 [Micromonospora craniellae]RFS48400.1 hypothetical protein D0Q02_02685 [Micromonospora craniellae]
MSEAGQPGAATPGEHGDGSGQRDDLARSGNGWAPSAADWSWGTEGSRDLGAPRRRAEPPSGWATASPRYADLPAPAGDQPELERATRTNGHHVNGVQPGDESSAGRHTPVSAPPGLRDSGRDAGHDRLVVPAPRPTPSGEQPVTSTSGLPTSAPPAVQVPPVGTAASGFEMPPGLHAPTAERAGDDPSVGRSHGWDEPYPAESTGASHPASEPSGPSGDRFGADQVGGWPLPSADRRAGRSAGGEPADDERPSWARSGPPSDWAPSWARGEDESSRRARETSAQSWTSEPSRPYEPVRAEPTRPYEPVPVEQSRPYEPTAAPPTRDRPSWAAEERPTWSTSPVSGAPADERPAWSMSPVSGAPADEHASWQARPVSAAPADEGLPWGARTEEGLPWGARTEEGLPWGTRVGGPPPADDRPPWALGQASAPPAAAPAGPRETTPPEPPVPPVTEATNDSGKPAYRPFRLRPVPSDPGPTAPAPASPCPPATPAHTEPVTGAPASDVPTHRERTPSAPVPTSAAPYAARRSAPDPEPAGDRSPDSTSAVLPQRVPAEPDVPVVPEPPAVEPPAETPELARIATHLRRDDEPAPLRERPEGFDVNAILDAVRGVAGVRDAALRRTPAGAHSLRLDLADGADPAEVSRHVARLLQERMGLAAAPSGVPGPPATPVRRRSTETRDGGESRPPAEPRRPVVRPAGARTEAPPVRTEPEPARRRRPTPAPPRGRAVVEETGPTGSPATLGASYSGGQLTTTESAPSRPLDTGGVPGPRVVLDHVQVSTFGLDATVEVRLLAGDQNAAGYATGPAVDGYVLRLCAVAAAAAIDELLHGVDATAERGRCFVEHAAVVPFGNCEVATVVVLLVCDGWVEQLAGSALVAGDPRQAVVRASLAAVNRRLEALLA